MRTVRLLLGIAIPVLTVCAASANALTGGSHAQVAFMRFKSSIYTEIWTTTGQGRRRLIRFLKAAVDEPAWSASGKRIAFTVDRDPPQGSRVEIYVANADGNRPIESQAGGPRTSRPPGRRTAAKLPSRR